MEIRRHLGMTGLALTLSLAALPALTQAFPPGDPGQQPPPNPGRQGQRRQGQPPYGGQPGQGRQGQNPFGGQPGQPGGFPNGFGPIGPPPMIPMPQTPELAKKTRTIMALRQMLGMRLTAKNIGAALPILKDLRDAEKALQGRAEQLLEEERRALLAADPEDPMPPGAGERMQQEMQRFNEKQGRAWGDLDRAIGPEKANGLRQLLGQGGPMGFPNGPAGFGPGGPFPPGGPGGNTPVGPAVSPRPGQRNPSPGLPPDPNGPPPADAPPVSAPEGVPEDPAAQEPLLAVAPGVGAPTAPAALAAQQPPPVLAAPGNPRQTRQPQRFTPQPGGNPFSAPAQFAGQGVPGQPMPMNLPFFQSPRLTLTELVELMEQKLVAMRR